MPKFRSARISISALMFLVACALPTPQTPTPQPLPSPQGKWVVRLTQSGGFAGVLLTVAVTSDGQLSAENARAGRTATGSLPPDTMTHLRRLISDSALATAGSPPSACADCFIYDLEFTSETGTTRVKLDDIAIGQSPAQALIQYLQTLRDAALRQIP